MRSVVGAKHYEEIGFPWIREEFQCSEDEHGLLCEVYGDQTSVPARRLAVMDLD
jgi:hypothetical protein